MRALTAKQKKLLLAEYNRLTNLGVEYPSIDDIPPETFDAIDSINYCELYWSNVQRMFDDLNFKKQYGYE